MKAGIVQCVEAVRQVREGPVTVLFTADEEVGSPTSRPLIEDEARGSRAVLVLEPAAGRAVKVARKGTGTYRVEVAGRAAHAGLAPDEGVNAALELARQIEAIGDVADPRAGTTVTVTMLGGGTATNVIPESAWCTVDVRMWTDEEAGRVDTAMAGLRASLDGAEIRVTGGLNRGPLEREASEGLYRRLVALGYDVGEAEVGGASDGNFTAALGVPTLDGLGAVGGGAHARGEHVLIDEMAPRAEMVARLTAELLTDG
jgi:glutamate carboxypeptidase